MRFDSASRCKRRVVDALAAEVGGGCFDSLSDSLISALLRHRGFVFVLGVLDGLLDLGFELPLGVGELRGDLLIFRMLLAVALRHARPFLLQAVDLRLQVLHRRVGDDRRDRVHVLARAPGSASTWFSFWMRSVRAVVSASFS